MVSLFSEDRVFILFENRRKGEKIMYKSYTMELAGRTLRVDIGRVGKQANGCAFMQYGETTVLSTATASEKPREGIDFFPCSVEYEEKLYSVGKIPGGFNKREGKASENAVLTSRVIDRPMRPLFPKDYRNDVTLNNMVMSVDPACRPELVAMIGTAIATCISDIPFDGPCAMTQMGMVDGELIVNPSQEQWDKGDLKMTVASTSQKVMMIEAGANEVPENRVLEAIYKAHEVNQTLIEFINKIIAEVGKPKHTYESCAIPEQMFEDIILDWFDEGDTGYNGFIRALLRDDLKEMNAYMNQIALSMFSSFDGGMHPSEKANPERFYHGFVLGLLVDLSGRYEITSNRESGFGRYDVMLKPLRKEDTGIILEFKVHDPKEESSLEETAAAALKQIDEKKYDRTLLDLGLEKENIKKYGFAFEGKKVLIGESSPL